MYSTVEIMDGCEYSIEIIIVPLKECKTEIKFFRNKQSTAERIIEQRMTARSPVKINTVSFKEWMASTLSVTKTYQPT